MITPKQKTTSLPMRVKKSRMIIAPGTRYGRLTVLREGERLIIPSGQTNRTMVCRCDCGVEKQIRLCHLNHGNTLSCGCNVGEFHGGEPKHLYGIWQSMRQRCSKDYNDHKHRYKDRGITVCSEWDNSFIAFREWALSNGWVRGIQIDRINNDGNYEPSNCRFVTHTANCNNREVTVRIEYNGKIYPLREILRDKNLIDHYYTIRTRLKRGWDGQRAIDTPIKIGNYWNRKHA